MASVVGEREIDLSKLSLEQLNQLKTQLSEEVEEVTRHFATLRDANSRLNTCRNTITDLAGQTEGTEILVPLTQSLYVPGKVKDAGKVLIDVGTGYFVEKTLSQAKDYIDKKINVVTQNAESVQEVLAQKEQSLRMVSGFMQHRIMAFQQQAQAQQAAAQQALGGGRKP